MTKLLCLVSLCLLLAVALTAQTTAAPPLPQNFFGMGAAYNTAQPATDSQSARAAGWLAYGHILSTSNNLYMFTRTDILPTKIGNHTAVQTAVTAGFCEVTNRIGARLIAGVCADGGESTLTDAQGNVHVGGAVTVDPMIVYTFGKKKNWGVMVMGGLFKSSLASLQTPLRFGVVHGF